VTLLKVTGWLPKTLEKRNRIILPQRSGLTMERVLGNLSPSRLCLDHAAAGVLEHGPQRMKSDRRSIRDFSRAHLEEATMTSTSHNKGL
jgi:hypothetical protein